MSSEMRPGSAQPSNPQSQGELRTRIAERGPEVLKFVKEKPIVGWKLTTSRFEDIPKAIRDHLGSVDSTTYSQAYLQENKGTIIALQMEDEKPDFYIIKKAAYEAHYEEVDLTQTLRKQGAVAAWLQAQPQLAAKLSAESGAIVGARKTVIVEMMKLSGLGFAIDRPVTIQSPWGTQTKPAGQDAYLAVDAASGEYYLINQARSGHPLSYVPAP